MCGKCKTNSTHGQAVQGAVAALFAATERAGKMNERHDLVEKYKPLDDMIYDELCRLGCSDLDDYQTCDYFETKQINDMMSFRPTDDEWFLLPYDVALKVLKALPTPPFTRPFAYKSTLDALMLSDEVVDYDSYVAENKIYHRHTETIYGL